MKTMSTAWVCFSFLKGPCKICQNSPHVGVSYTQLPLRKQLIIEFPLRVYLISHVKLAVDTVLFVVMLTERPSAEDRLWQTTVSKM